MPEGDSVHRAAARLRALEGEVIEASSPHPRAAALGIAEAIDGRRLERVEAAGKNILLTFEGGLVVRSHLRMRGRWRVEPRSAARRGAPWLVLRGSKTEAVLWNGPVLELGRGRLARLGPDIMATPPELEAMLDRLRSAGQGRELGEALLDQRLVAGIGNMWKAEALFLAGTPPWAALGELTDDELRRVLAAAARAMRAPRGRRHVYRRAGRPCRRCATPVRSAPQGDEARRTYWCPVCQAGTEGASA